MPASVEKLLYQLPGSLSDEVRDLPSSHVPSRILIESSSRVAEYSRKIKRGMATRSSALRNSEGQKIFKGSDQLMSDVIWTGSPSPPYKPTKSSQISHPATIHQESAATDNGDGVILSDPFAELWSGSQTKNRGLGVFVREQVSTAHDGAPTSIVEGRVYVKRISNHTNPTSLSLFLRDKYGLLEQMRLHTKTDDIPDPTSIQESVRPSDRAVQVRLSGPQLASQDTLVASYTCSSQLRPIPLLMKGRIVSFEDSVRGAFKLRSNPSNEMMLTHITIIVAIPFHVDGESIKLVPSYGAWDEVKRTISWSIDQISPGEVVDFLIHLGQRKSGFDEDTKLPILVHAKSAQHFSRLEVSTDVSDPSMTPMVNYSGVVVHRKAYG